MPVVADTDNATVTALLDALPPGSQGVDSAERMRAWLDVHSDEYVVVLGPHLDLDDALKVCEDLRTTRPMLSVVLVRAEVDTDVLTRAMQAGARDVVPDGETASGGRRRGARPRAARRPARARRGRTSSGA